MPPCCASAAAAFPIIRQTEAAECGLACLAMVASYYGHRLDLNTLRRRYPVSLNGVTLRALIQMASHLELVSRPLRFELEHLRQLHLPAILHWDMSHFVVLKSVTRKGITIIDPAAGEKSLTLPEASKHVTGVALELSPTAGFHPPRRTRAAAPVRILESTQRQRARSASDLHPVDRAADPGARRALLHADHDRRSHCAWGCRSSRVLALGFGLLMLVRVASTAIRSMVLLVMQNVLHFRLGARLFRHLIRLPMSFFEKRHIGDILSRFGSLQPIRNLLAEGMIAALIDGMMAVLTLVMIFLYSATLAWVVVAALLAYAIVRLALYRVLWLRTEATIQAGAQENSTFIETVRAIQSLKLFNRESEREGQWLNRYADVVNANVRLGRAKIAFGTVNDLIFGLETIITVYLAARFVLANQLTVGMMFAFMAYKQHFTEKSVALVEKALELRILGLHLERLSDIALTPLEKGHDQPLSYVRPSRGHSNCGMSSSAMPIASHSCWRTSISRSSPANSSPSWALRAEAKRR